MIHHHLFIEAFINLIELKKFSGEVFVLLESRNNQSCIRKTFAQRGEGYAMEGNQHFTFLCSATTANSLNDHRLLL